MAARAASGGLRARESDGCDIFGRQLEHAMLTSALGVALAIILLWIAAQLFGGRFSRFPYSEQQGCIVLVIAMLLMLGIYVFSLAP
jgi:hypothetical protein